MLRPSKRWPALSCAALFAACLGSASTGSAASSPSPSPSGSATAKGDDASTPSIDVFEKGAEVSDGIFPLIRKDGKIYLQLTKDQFDTDFYEHATTANGLGGFGILSGDDFAQPAYIVKFERVADKKVALVVPQQRMLAQPDTPIQNAVDGSTPRSVMAVMPVVASDKAAGTVVIDPAFLLGDNLDLGPALSDIAHDPENPESGYHLDPTRSFYGPAKAFPQNDVIEADLTFASAHPGAAINTVEDPHTVAMRVKYNFSAVLSSPDYMPRLADDRVGFWEDPHIDFNRDDTYDDIARFVTRWDIRATDPSKPSPALHPIVYTLTNTIPTAYKPAIRDALLQWNKAFARFGILDVVRVEDQPSDPNWDPDDIRYNPVRWLTEANGGGFAEAQIEWDPRTGQIFRSGILIDADLVRYGKFYYPDVIAPNAGADSSDGDVAAIPELWDPAALAAPKPRLPHFLHRDVGAREQAQYGLLAMALFGENAPPAYTYDFLKSIVMHESGHDFGLAHNFIGHDAYTAGELRSRAFTSQYGVASSVMEYSPVNLWPHGWTHGDYFQTVLGPYDYHAIHWGYAPIPSAHAPADEVSTLDRWAQSAVDPRFAFASDEDVEYDGHAVDPRIAQWMLTSDSIEWCDTQLHLDRDLLRSLDTRFPRPEMPWDQERYAFRVVMNQYARCSIAMTHYIGGEYLSRARRGDPSAPLPLTPVSRAQERRAYEALDRYVFADSAWQISPATLRRLVYSEYEPEFDLGYQPMPRHDLSLSAMVAGLQNVALRNMFSTLMLQRLADLPSKAAAADPAMTLGDLFTWTQSSVYGDLQRAAPGSSVLRHNLQRNYARLLETLAIEPPAGTPNDAQALALHELVALSGNVRHSLTDPHLDLQTRAHLEALGSEVARTIDTRNVTHLGS